MKKWILAIVLGILCLVVPTMASAAEKSSDTMILDFEADKIWMDKGDLCMRATFYNKRHDLTITKLNDLTVTINFKQKDGKVLVYTAKPKKKPMMKLNAGASKSVMMNLGPFSGDWDGWTADAEYTFTYISGSF